VTFSGRNPARRYALSRVGVDPAVLAGHFENRPQEPEGGQLRPRADGEGVDELLDISAADLVEWDMAEARIDAEFPMLGVAAPGLG